MVYPAERNGREAGWRDSRSPWSRRNGGKNFPGFPGYSFMLAYYCEGGGYVVFVLNIIGLLWEAVDDQSQISQAWISSAL